MTRVPWPGTLQINAWLGDGTSNQARVANGSRAWALRPRLSRRKTLLAAKPPADPRDWRDPQVGWGLVLPENDSIQATRRATADDQPEPVHRLLDARPGAPVFRYRTKLPETHIRRHFGDGTYSDLKMDSGVGTGPDQVPQYLLIVGSPAQVPWSFQYVLNAHRFVGRLDLGERGLENYVNALLTDWRGASANRAHPLAWATDHGPDDITALMKDAIASPVAKLFHGDAETQTGLRTLMGAHATRRNLATALAKHEPGFVLTTSHGMTGPLDNPDEMRKQLGWLVDQQGNPCGPDDIASPHGAIWYAHACCSAGSDTGTMYEGLLDPESAVFRTLSMVGALGAQTAPLPRALLGASKPIRAFVGHVEPTFDWTLRHPDTGQVLADGLVDSLYTELYQSNPVPIGMALRGCHAKIGQLITQWYHATQGVIDHDPLAPAEALRAQMAALDWQSLVVLGDPTVALPRPA